MVDAARLRRLLDTLEDYRRRLQPHQAMTVDDYLAGHPFEARYLVQTAAQSCIDIANHVIASEGWRVPTDYGDAFAVLHEHQLIDTELADQLARLARMRNLLVHLYGAVDDRIVHQSLQTGLADMDSFARAAASLANDEDADS